MAQPIRPTVAFAVGKVVRLVEPELKSYDEARVKLLKEYGRVSESDPMRYEFETPEKAQAFADELNALLEQEIELTFKPILLSQLDDKDSLCPHCGKPFRKGAEISGQDMFLLDWLIVEDE